MNKLKVLYRLGTSLIGYKSRVEQPWGMPLRLWVETSNLCNLKCPMCPNKDLSGESRKLMELDLFKRIVDQAKGVVNDMYLHHRGEPFTNPALFDMIRYAEATGIKTRFHTNGGIMTEERAIRLLDAKPHMVSFSVDGFSKAPYEQARPGATFETTVQNILFLVAEKKKRCQKLPYIVVERIRFRVPHPDENAADVEALRQRFLSSGVDEVIEKAEYDWSTEDKADCDLPPAGNCCTFPWYAMVVCADGTVTPCPQDFWAKMNMGDLNRQSMREIWHGEAYRKLRRSLNNRVEDLALCRKCDRLCRKTVGGVPWQYAVTFLTDQLAGYGKVRKMLGTAERN